MQIENIVYEESVERKKSNLRFIKKFFRNLSWKDINSSSLLDYTQEELNNLINSFTSDFLKNNSEFLKVNNNEEAEIRKEIKKILINIIRKGYLVDFDEECDCNIINRWDIFKKDFLGGVSKNLIIEDRLDFMRFLYFIKHEEWDILYFSKDIVNKKLWEFKEKLELFFEKIKREEEEKKKINEIKRKIKTVS